MSDEKQPVDGRHRRRPWRFPRLRRREISGRGLLSVALLDEFTAAIIVVQLPLIREQLHLTYAQTGLVMTAGALSALVIEPILLAMADRTAKRPWLLGGLLTLAAAYALGGAAPSFAWLVLAAILLWPASGLVCGCAQALLVDLNAASGGSALAMTRWALWGSIGDVGGPLAIAALAAGGWNWRAVFSAGGAAWLFYAVWVLRRPQMLGPLVSLNVDAAESEVSFWAAIHQAAATPALWRWAFLLELVCLLDEVLIALASLYLRQRLGMSESRIALAIGVHCASSVVALMVLERLLTRYSRPALLRGSATLTLGGLVLYLLATEPVTAFAAMAILGAGAVALYPILKAQAYDALPGRSGTVLALLAVLAPIGMVQPWLLGCVADHFGLGVAISLVGACPLATLALTPVRDTRPQPPTPP